MKKLLIILSFAYINLAHSQELSVLKLNLEKFLDANISARQSIPKIVKAYGFDSYQMDSLNQMMHFQDSLHLRLVINVINEFGWLGITEIGNKANSSLFLAILQAENGRLKEKYLPLLIKSAEEGESNLAEMATLQDRVLIQQKNPQIYGTQWNYFNNSTVLFPISDPKNVNERRTSVGLKPISSEDLLMAQTKFQ